MERARGLGPSPDIFLQSNQEQELMKFVRLAKGKKINVFIKNRAGGCLFFFVISDFFIIISY